MMRLLARTLPVVAAIALLAAAMPASAQVDPGPAPPIGEPRPPEEDQARCLPVGLGLTVISQDGLIADILPALLTDDGGTDVRPHTIVLPGPGPVGACAEYQGYWAPQTYGTGAAHLLLHQVENTASGATASRVVAADRLSETKRGPAQHKARLAAITKLERPGKYHFLAELAVSAEAASAVTTRGGVKDSYKVAFVVEVRGEEQPQAGAIEGHVYTVRDGQRVPLGGAAVKVIPVPQLVRPGERGAVLPISHPSVDSAAPEPGLAAVVEAEAEREGDERGDPGRGMAVTDENGHYLIETAQGAYYVVAAARGFETQYYEGQTSPSKAKPVEVVGGKTVSGINFKLRPAEEPKPPEPPVEPKVGLISGFVGTADGAPLGGATVVAVPMPKSDDPDPKPLPDPEPDPGNLKELRVATDESGRYRMRAPVGHYLVSAHFRGYARQWYPKATGPDGARPVPVKADTITDGIDFALTKGDDPRPEPPAPEEHGYIKGRVLTIDSSGAEVGLAGAVVMAVAAPGERRPGDPPREPPLGDDPRPGDEPRGPVARTDRDGFYELKVPVGDWSVSASAEGYEPQWYMSPEHPNRPMVFHVDPGEIHDGIEFRLVRAPTTRIIGQVTVKGTDRGIPGAIVVAFSIPDPNVPGAPADPVVQFRTITKEDGSYVMPVEPGVYAVGLLVHPQHSDPDKAFLWWDEKTKLEDADPVKVIEGQTRNNINFAVAPSTTP